MKHLILTIALLAFSTTAVAQGTPTTAANTTPVSAGKLLKDMSRGIEFTTPNVNWNINDNQTSIVISHQNLYDSIITLKKSWFQKTEINEIYTARQKSLKSYIPNAVYIRENQKMTLSGTVPAVSMTYKNPSDLKISREIFFIHKGQAYELVFQAKEGTFPNVKDEFGSILNGIKLF